MDSSWIQVQFSEVGKNWVRLDANRITRAVRLSLGRTSETKSNILKVDKHVILHNVDFAALAFVHTLMSCRTRYDLERSGFDPTICMCGVGGIA